MAEKQVRGRAGSGGQSPGEHAKHRGHEIFIPTDDRDLRVVIDGEPIRYGKVADGYYLETFAYDRDPSLLEVIKRYLDHRDAAEERRKGGPR